MPSKANHSMLRTGTEGLIFQMSDSHIKSRERVLHYGEVFTAEREVNAMLDLLPPECFRPDSRFLEPACGDGNFLSAILERKFAELRRRYNTTCLNYEAYTLQALASLYGIDILQDNVDACRKRLFNIWNKEYTAQCKSECTDETREAARSIISCNIICENALTFMRAHENNDIKFDVIIGNPPYHLNDGGGNGASAKPIYHLFVENAIKLNPKYISMITPSRWFTGGKGLDNFRHKMLADKKLRVIHDFIEASDCFPGVQIKGGVSFFLWNRDNEGDCSVYSHKGNIVTGPVVRPLSESGCDIFIRYNKGVTIFRKVMAKPFKSMENIVSTRLPFGIPNTYKGNKEKTDISDLQIYVSGNDMKHRGSSAYVPLSDISRGHNLINRHKVFIAKAGSGSDTFPHPILAKPFYGAPRTVCNESYLVIGPFDDKEICDNVISYISTRFFRFMVLLKKSSQNAPKGVYGLVPQQDFSKSWTDKELYEKYNLSDEEISFIGSMVSPME